MSNVGEDRIIMVRVGEGSRVIWSLNFSNASSYHNHDHSDDHSSHLHLAARLYILIQIKFSSSGARIIASFAASFAHIS